MAVLTSRQSGNWSVASTWDLNRVPAAGDQVVISSGHTVTYDIVEGSSADVELGTAANSLDIDIRGTLRFNTSATQPLRLRFKGYIRIRGTGKLIVGTPSDPMPVRVTLMKTTAGFHMILYDNNAEVSLVGSPNVPYDSDAGYYRFITTLASSASSGATQITVSENLNWQVGDWVMLPRLPAAEVPTSIALPFLAQVTSVSGNTLTLDTALPHAYPAGAWVAKANRPILISFNNNAHTLYPFAHAASGNYINVTGLRWVWYQASGTLPYYFMTNGNLNDSNISYNALLPHYLVYHTIQNANINEPTIYYHCGALFQALNKVVRHIGGVLTSHIYLFGGRRHSVVENAYIWSWYVLASFSAKAHIKNCTIFNFAPRLSTHNIVEDSIIYGLNYIQGNSVPYLARNIFRNCKFYNYSSLGYSTTMRNRFDWGDISAVMLADYKDCELYGTWVEPYTFADAIGYDMPKVRFVNKKVGDTVIKEQEFQAGGIITADDAALPPEGNISYTLKFEPKNADLPVVYDLPVSPKGQVVVYFNRQSAITGVAKIQLIRFTDQLVTDPTTVTPLMEIDLTSYPAGQWFKVLVVNTEMSNALLRVMCRGTSGALWVGFEHLGERQFVKV